MRSIPTTQHDSIEARSDLIIESVSEAEQLQSLEQSQETKVVNSDDLLIFDLPETRRVVIGKKRDSKKYWCSPLGLSPAQRDQPGANTKRTNSQAVSPFFMSTESQSKLGATNLVATCHSPCCCWAKRLDLSWPRLHFSWALEHYGSPFQFDPLWAPFPWQMPLFLPLKLKFLYIEVLFRAVTERVANKQCSLRAFLFSLPLPVVSLVVG